MRRQSQQADHLPLGQPEFESAQPKRGPEPDRRSGPLRGLCISLHSHVPETSLTHVPETSLRNTVH